MKFTFLFCTERSGSNLITSLANGHSEISGPPPSHLFRLFGLNCHRYLPTTQGQNWEDFLDDFCAARDSMLGEWSTSFTREELQAACPRMRIAEAFDFMYGRECAHDGSSQAFVKENYTYRITPFLLASWPDCTFVHQVRDPRDVAASWTNTRSIAGATARAVDVWLEDQSRTLEVFDQIDSAGRALRIRYEDLLQDPESTTRTLCAHVGIEFEPGMFDFYREARTRLNAEKIDAWANLSRPLLVSNSGKYKEALTADEVRYIELRCGELMALLGYRTDNDVAGLDPEARDQELAVLAPRIRTGSEHGFDTRDESATRRRRQAVIDRIISRPRA